MSEADRQPPTIPGYTLTTRLGAGGYGEVWLAHAPGGLTKAVKIIFGAFDGRRAELELRSLHRIKMVRHPFLLSLERIEVVDNRLAIVTELAGLTNAAMAARPESRGGSCLVTYATPQTRSTSSARDIRCSTSTSSPRTC